MADFDAETGEVFEGVPTVEVECSQNCGQLFKALALAQGEISNAEKTGSNEAFKRGGKASTYSTLAAIFDACRAALSKNGIAVIQVPYNAGEDIGVATLLAHASGQWIKGKMQVKPREYTAHGAGSVITYLRRYVLSAMVGVAPEDDDGNAASIGSPSAPPKPASRPQQKSAMQEDGERAEPASKAAAEPATKVTRDEALKMYQTFRASVAAAPHATAIDSLVAEWTRNGNLAAIKHYGDTAYGKCMESVTARKTMLSADDGEIPA